MVDAAARVDGFDDWPHADKLRFFAWALHANGKESLRPADFAACYTALHLHAPTNIHRSLQALEEQRDLLKSRDGYRLAKPARERLESQHGSRPITTQVHEALASLPGKLTAPAQREYLDEALRCFRAASWRAAAIMAWNLAFDHLVQAIVVGKLAEFNAEYARAHSKKPMKFAERSDFQEIKESEVIRIARTIGVTDKNQHGVLERNLDVRNSIAHPSAFAFKQPQSENFILEVIQTVVLGTSG